MQAFPPTLEVNYAIKVSKKHLDQIYMKQKYFLNKKLITKM